MISRNDVARLALSRHSVVAGLMACVLLCMVGTVRAETNRAPAAQAITQLVTQLTQMDQLRGQFTQQVMDSQGAVLQESSGEFTLLRPGYMLWKTLLPFEQWVIADREYIWVYDPDLEQVTRQDYDKHFDRTPALLLSGDVAAIRDTFTVQQQGDDTFELKPLNDEATFDELRFEFRNQQPRQLLFTDTLAQQTRLSFSHVVRDNSISHLDFAFEPPQGADLLIDE